MANNNVTQPLVDSDTLMSDSVAPFSFFNLTPSPNPTSPPAGLGLVLGQETNPFGQARNVVFSSNLNFNAIPVYGPPETYEIPDLNETYPIPDLNEPAPIDMDMNMEVEPQPMMLGPLNAQQIMFPEEYTRVRVNNGPNPIVTHIFGDCVLNGHLFDCAPPRVDLQTAVNPYHYSSYSLDLQLESDLFLKNCFVCKNVLRKDENIYLLRDKTFCSEECRYQELWFYDQEERREQAQEEQEEQAESIYSDDDSSTCTASSTSQGAIFYIGDVPKSDQLW